MRTAWLAAITAAALVTAARAAEVTIDQRGQMISKKDISVASGDAVTFANDDDVTHNISVFNDDAGDEDLGLQKPGQAVQYRFDKHGRFKIRCSIHPSMRMIVQVQ